MNILKPRNKFEKGLETMGYKVVSVRTSQNVKRFNGNSYYTASQSFVVYTVVDKNDKFIMKNCIYRKDIKDTFNLWLDAESQRIICEIKNSNNEDIIEAMELDFNKGGQYG